MVKSAIENGSRLLFQTQNTIISAASVLAAMYGVSAIFGLVRARLLAHYFGASEELGVFYTADRIPSFVYSILVVGTLSTVFIPVFTHLLKKDEAAAWKTASSMISVSLLFFFLLGAPVFYFAPDVIELISVGKFTPEQVKLGADMMRIMLASQFVLVVGSFLTSILQSFKYFLVPALAPILYNLGMILGIVLFVPFYGIYAPAFGVVLGALLHLSIQVPLLRRVKFNFSLKLDFGDKGLRNVLSLLPPRILSSAISQLSSVVSNSLAILVSTSSVVVYKFADQLQSFPVYLFGASIALAALPTLAGESDGADMEQFKKTFLTSFHQMLFLVVPASVILLVLRVPAVRLVYGAANFPWEATIQTAQALAFFSISIPMQAAILLLSRAFYAMRDTLTPVIAALFGLFVEVMVAFVLIAILGYGVWSISLGASLGAFFGMFILTIALLRKIGGVSLDSFFKPTLKIGAAGVFMGLSLYIPMKLLDIYVLDTTKTVYLVVLAVVVSVVGLFSYVFFTRLLKVREIELFYKLLRKMNLNKFIPSYIVPAAREIDHP